MDWYRGERQRLWIFSRTALWPTPGLAPVAIGLVLGQDPEGQLSDAAFFCTTLPATPEQSLHWGVMRGAVEVTFEEARAHLGVETHRQWSDLAMARTTPGLWGLFPRGTVLAWRFCPSGHVSVAATAWYHKSEVTFVDCLAVVRQQIWRVRH